MKREILGSEISQQSKTGFFSATDLVKIGNNWRRENKMPELNFTAYLRNKSTMEFISELENKYEVVYVKGRGKGTHTWVHPLLFIDIALAINPKLKVEVYEWLFDNLIKYRNDSGDSYKAMGAAIFSRFNNNREFPKYMQRVANYIKKELNVTDWETATEKQLQLRDKIHNSIQLLCNVLNNTDQAVRLGVIETLKMVDK